MSPVNNSITQENSQIETYLNEVFKGAGRMPKMEEALDLAFFVKHLVSIDANNLQYASDRLKNNKEIILYTINKDGTALRFASEKLKDNRKIVLLAIKNNESNKSSCPEAFQYASLRLKTDKAFVRQALETDSNVIDYVSQDIQRSLLEKSNHKKLVFPQMLKLISIANKFRDMIHIPHSKAAKSKKIR